MAITNNIDLVVTYDAGQLVASARILAATATDAEEHAAQVCCIEMLREILASGITLDEWNSTANPWMYQGMTWEEWTADLHTRAHPRATLNVAAFNLPFLTTEQRDQAHNMAYNFFEQGYTAIMAGTSAEDKTTFTRTGGL